MGILAGEEGIETSQDSIEQIEREFCRPRLDRIDLVIQNLPERHVVQFRRALLEVGVNAAKAADRGDDYAELHEEFERTLVAWELSTSAAITVGNAARAREGAHA